MIDLDRVMALFKELYPDNLDFIKGDETGYQLVHRIENEDKRTGNVIGYEELPGGFLGRNLNQVWDTLWAEKSRRKWVAYQGQPDQIPF